MLSFILFRANMKFSMTTAQRGLLLPVLVSFLMMALLRRWRRCRPLRAEDKARGTLTAAAVRASSHSHASRRMEAVEEVVLKPIERAMQPWLDGPRMLVCDHDVFRVGSRVTNRRGTEGTIVGVDKDGDLAVFLKNGHAGIFYAKQCRKAMSIGDRVRYNCGAIGEIIDFDKDDDLLVKLSTGTNQVWYRSFSQRLPSVGDRVHHTCKAMGTLEGFDKDGDFKVKMSNGESAVWYANKSRQGIGSLDPEPEWPALPAELP